MPTFFCGYDSAVTCDYTGYILMRGFEHAARIPAYKCLRSGDICIFNILVRLYRPGQP